jgi:quinol monooxygenase YgiN
MYVSETELAIEPTAERRLLRAMEPYGSRTRKDPGVLRCELLRHADDRCKYVLYEAFNDEATHDAHMRKKHTTLFRFDLNEMALGPLVTRKLENATPLVAPAPVARAPAEASSRSSAWETVANARSKNLKRDEPFVWMRAKLSRVEFATATDGPLRGFPDPALVLAIYRLEDQKPALIGRLLWRITMAREAPYVVQPSEAILEVPCSIQHFPAKVIVMVIGIEENGGRGVQEAYQRLEPADGTMLSKIHHDEATTCGLAEFSSGDALPPQAVAVLPIVDGAALSDHMHNDTWVGAGASVIELRPLRLEEVVQFHLCTHASVNDWRVTVCLNLGTGMG